ncbi:hypothetical protein JOM56_010248 [Amanita muscaria]
MSTSVGLSDNLSQLHRAFHILTTLLTLISAINNDGHPKLGDKRIYRYQSDILDSDAEQDSISVNALAALLVRDAEIIAIMPEMLSMANIHPSYAVIGNPEKTDKRFKTLEDDIQVVLVEDGISVWEEIVKKPWCKLDGTRRGVSLANHIKTLCDYFQSYQDCGQNGNLRAGVFQKATIYLISSSWRKMLRRISHWSSHGFIMSLEIDIPQLHSSYEDFHKNMPPDFFIYQKPDKTLARLFLESSEDDIAKIVNNHPHFPGVSPELPNLRKAFRDVESATQTTGYTADSYVEFHQLLLAILFGYEKALNNLKSHEAGSSSIVGAATEVWNLTHFLWRIACSRMLRYHLAVLKFGKLLVIPTFSAKSIYHRQTVTHQNNPGTDTSTEEDPVAVAVDEEPDEGDIANLNMGEENPDVALVFLRWFRLHVTQFIALNNISAFCARSASRFTLNISLLAVRSPPQSNISWEEAIQELASLHPPGVNGTFNAKASIDFIKKKVNIRSIGREPFKSLPQFSKPCFALPGTVHCEAALASLSKYSEQAAAGAHEDRQRVLDLLQKTNASSISVSKLCCPVCWDLLDILRSGNSDLMKVRGRHTTVFPVCLPSWLPSEVMTPMVTQYQTYLYNELVKMAKMLDSSSGQLMHSRSPSMQSASGISEAGSDDSDAHPMQRMPVPAPDPGSLQASMTVPDSSTNFK